MLNAPGGQLSAKARDLTGKGAHPAESEPHLYDGFPFVRAVLLEADDLDRAMARFDLEPVPSQAVTVKLEVGR